jgi:hypothetical protein
MMNQVQRTYALAKAHLEALQDEENEVDRKYIADHHIINADGTTPRAAWAIDDDEIANKAIDETAKIVEESGLWTEVLAARELLKSAEAELIKYGLEIMPAAYASEKAALQRAAEKDYTTRQKMIDLTMRLDASTVMA